MSDQVIAQLRDELQKAISQVQGLSAQLEAHQQMVNEGLQASVNLRTNLVLYQKAHKDVSAGFNEQCKLNEQLNVQVKALTQEVADLKAAASQAAPVSEPAQVTPSQSDPVPSEEKQAAE